jgi:hypothetical protein
MKPLDYGGSLKLKKCNVLISFEWGKILFVSSSKVVGVKVYPRQT